MTQAVEISNPFETATVLLSHSIENRQKMEEDIKDKIPSLVASLVECALGVWKEQDVTNKKGELVGVKVYQLAPDVKAINALMRMANYEPDEMAQILLSMSRVKSIEAEVSARVAERKAENLRSQTLLNDKNALAFEASFVLEEDVQGAAMSVFSAIVGFIQSIPVEVMRDEISKTQASYQEWQMKLATIGEEAYQQFTVDKPAIESGDDDTGEEEDE